MVNLANSMATPAILGLETPAAPSLARGVHRQGGFDSFLHGGAALPPDAVGKAVLDWMRQLRVTEGRYAGEPLTILPWQADFIAKVLAPEIAEGCLTIARGNGKTTISAALAAAAVAGPLMRPRSQTVVVASSFDQARILFEHTRHFLAPVLEAHPHSWRVVDNFATALIENRLTGAKLRCIGSDAKRAHGIAPSLVLADEPAKWQQGGEAMLTALETSLGKQADSKLISLGTRPESKLHWFRHRVETPADGRVVAAYSGDVENWRDEAQWLKANPSLPHMPDLERQLRKEAKEAESNPATLAAFRALRLNGGTRETDAHDELVTAEQWADCLAAPVPPPEGTPVWALDLGGTGAMSALAAAWPNGRLDVLAMFGNRPSLLERGAIDGVGRLYAQCADTGELMVSQGRIPDVAQLFEAGYDRWGGMPAALVADRWRVGELQQALEAAPRHWQRVPLITRGQGYRDGAADVRDFRKAVQQATVRPVRPGLLLTAALSEAVVVTDSAGNSKLAKKTEGGRRSRARDDAAAAAILAVAFRERGSGSEQAIGGYRGAA